MGSLWTQHMEMPEFGELRKDIRTQVLIIGGGMTGILCAYFLEQAGVDYCLLEKGHICMEATAHTLGMVTAQPGLSYEKALQSLGQERAGLFLEANRKAVENYRNLGNFVDCDLEEKEVLLYSIKDRRKLEREKQALGSLGVTAEYTEQTALPFEVMGALRFPGQLALHPLKFASGLARNLRIYENSEVKEMTEYFALTEKGSVAAEKIIVATKNPIVTSRGAYRVKLGLARGYTIAVDCTTKPYAMYQSIDREGISFSSYKNQLLLTTEEQRNGHAGEEWERLRRFIREYYPEAQERYFWKNEDCVPIDERPYIGPYSRTTPDLYVATGFQKCGLTGAMLSAMVLSDLVRGKENPYAPLFSPARNPIRPGLFRNIGQLFRKKNQITY